MAEVLFYANVPIVREQVMEALRAMTIDNEFFRHERWSIWDAEVMERAAKMIREGYKSSEVRP